MTVECGKRCKMREQWLHTKNVKMHNCCNRRKRLCSTLQKLRVNNAKAAPRSKRRSVQPEHWAGCSFCAMSSRACISVFNADWGVTSAPALSRQTPHKTEPSDGTKREKWCNWTRVRSLFFACFVQNEAHPQGRNFGAFASNRIPCFAP